MVVLVDTNVIIDFLITREPFYKASMEGVMKCARRELEGCIAMHSIPKLWYILRGTPEEKRRNFWKSFRGTGDGYEKATDGKVVKFGVFEEGER